MLRWLAWSSATIGATSYHGGNQVSDELPRTIALVIIPAVMPGVRATLTRLEATEQRLESLIENSTDVVTVGYDVRRPRLLISAATRTGC